ncbi:MAG: hypothetical protein ACJAW7_002609 [Candidatus Azotimanducaceae bacterium]
MIIGERNKQQRYAAENADSAQQKPNANLD